MSLLKRIEQGQNSNSSGQTPSDNQGGEGSRLSSLQARRVNAPITSPQAGSYFDLKTRVQNKLLSELDPSMDITRTEDVRRTIQDLFEQILAEENIVLSRPERARLFEQICAVDHDFCNGVIFQKRLQWTKTKNLRRNLLE